MRWSTAFGQAVAADRCEWEVVGAEGLMLYGDSSGYETSDMPVVRSYPSGQRIPYGGTRVPYE